MAEEWGGNEVRCHPNNRPVLDRLRTLLGEVYLENLMKRIFNDEETFLS